MTAQVSRFMNELLAEAREQRWKVQRKENFRYVFCVPLGCARPGYDAVSIDDPFQDSHSQKVVRKRLTAAGFKFHDDEEHMATTTTTVTRTSGTVTLATSGEVNPFGMARQKINAAVSLLSEIEQLLGKIESDTQKIRNLRELLKEI